jgi:hypothetical protein
VRGGAALVLYETAQRGHDAPAIRGEE